MVDRGGRRREAESSILIGKHHYEPRECISSIAGKSRIAIYGVDNRRAQHPRLVGWRRRGIEVVSGPG